MSHFRWHYYICSSYVLSAQYMGSTVLFKPPETDLPAGLLAPSSLVQLTRGTVHVLVVNVGTIDVVLYP